MAPRVQQLGIVHRLFADVCSGVKTSTIRWNEGTVVPGPLCFVCDDHPDETIDVEVGCCTHMRLAEVAEFVGEDWTDAVLLNGMRSHYADIDLGSVVQVVEFELPSSSEPLSR